MIGELAGSSRAEESIIFSAHYDHLGIRPDAKGDGIYNGARDNASGVAGLIEVAEALATAPAPARTMYFVATTAEESGLFGAEHLAAHPPMAIDRVAANINMDSLNVYGPARELVLLGSDRSTLGALAERLATKAGERWRPIRRRSGARSSARIISRLRKPACLRSRSASAIPPASMARAPTRRGAWQKRITTRNITSRATSRRRRGTWREPSTTFACWPSSGWSVATTARRCPSTIRGEQFGRPRRN